MPAFISPVAFTGTDGTTLETLDAAAWGKFAGAGINAILASNRARAASTSTCAYYHKAAPPSADYAVQAAITRVAASTTQNGICARASGTATNTHYHVRMSTSTTNAMTVQLYKWVAGTPVLLGSQAGYTFAVGDTHTLRLECNGSSIKALLNGVTAVGPIPDTDISAPGFAGFRLTSTEAHLDDFTAEDFAAAGGITGALAASEASSSDTAAASGAVLVQGASAASEAGDDAAAAAGAVLVAGALSAAEAGSDTANLNGSSAVTATGVLAAAEMGEDAAAAVGVVPVQGLVAAVDAEDSAAAAGAVLVQGAVAAVEVGEDAASILQAELPPAPAGSPHGFEMGRLALRETSTAPRLWWQRRGEPDDATPPAPPTSRKRAKALLREVVIDLAQQHAREALADGDAQPPAGAAAEVAANVAPILPAVPGIDWRALYQRMYERAVADATRARAAQEDEEAALLLLLAA